MSAAAAAEPEIKIVFPAAGACLSAEGRTFVIGSVVPPETPLTVNSQTVTPWRTGGFLFMAPVSPGTNTFVLRAGALEQKHTFTVSPAAPAVRGDTLTAVWPQQPIGVCTGETLRLECLAPTGHAVFAAVGERTLALRPDPADPTRHQGTITFATPVETVPVLFYADALTETTHAPTITARAEWPVFTVTGNVFETRVRAAPGEGETVGFPTPGQRMRGAGFIGKHTRVWFGGHLRYVETRLLAPAPAGEAAPPRDVAPPDIGAGFGPHPPTNRPPSGLLILLDPGHGGSATGAIGPTGVPEKQVTLEQAKTVKTALEEAGFRVRLTRERDEDLGLYERVRLAYFEKAAALISIHYNSCAPSGNPEERRHIATYAWNVIGRQLACALHPHLVAATGLADGGVQTASFAVCRNPAVPSVLLELDFITSPEGEEIIQTPERQKRVAEAVLAGLRAWLGPAAP